MLFRYRRVSGDVCPRVAGYPQRKASKTKHELETDDLAAAVAAG